MPGPVSDSFDPEFGSGANANDVRVAIQSVRDRVTKAIGTQQLINIIELAHADDGPVRATYFSERQLRIIRFCLDRAQESI